MPRHSRFALMLVTDDVLLGQRDPVAVCVAAVAAGVTMVQLRLKHANDREFLDTARRLVAAVSVPVIVNDRLDIALAAGAAGVHLGSDDLSPALARGIAPDGFLVGASVGTLDEVPRGLAADYWGIGPLRTTSTKADAGQTLGWEGVRQLSALSGQRPVLVIGGVLAEDVAPAREAGCSGVAVVSGILGAADLVAAVGRYRDQAVRKVSGSSGSLADDRDSPR